MVSQTPESFAYGSLPEITLTPIKLGAEVGEAVAGRRTNLKSNRNQQEIFN